MATVSTFAASFTIFMMSVTTALEIERRLRSLADSARNSSCSPFWRERRPKRVDDLASDWRLDMSSSPGRPRRRINPGRAKDLDRSGDRLHADHFGNPFLEVPLDAVLKAFAPRTDSRDTRR